LASGGWTPVPKYRDLKPKLPLVVRYLASGGWRPVPKAIIEFI